MAKSSLVQFKGGIDYWSLLEHDCGDDAALGRRVLGGGEQLRYDVC